MSFEARRHRVAMDLEFGILLRILKDDEVADPYEEMQKLPNINILIIFWEDVGEIRIYFNCLMDLCEFHGCRLLNETKFKQSEDKSFLVAESSEKKFLTIDDAVGVYFYLNDWMFVQGIKLPRVYILPN